MFSMQDVLTVSLICSHSPSPLFRCLCMRKNRFCGVLSPCFAVTPFFCFLHVWVFFFPFCPFFFFSFSPFKHARPHPSRTSPPRCEIPRDRWSERWKLLLSCLPKVVDRIIDPSPQLALESSPVASFIWWFSCSAFFGFAPLNYNPAAFKTLPS